MSRIHILPDILCNKIAAGEVVQRPASVVKELVENSIDAESTRIEVTIKNGGRDLIQVIDDGVGLDKEELGLALERHATSKIAEIEDLFRIKTMGFRGEALPSIASVAMLEVVSRAQGSEAAFALEVQAGKSGDVQPIAWETGTRITVKNLFFNVPARLKFLKAKRTELNHIIDRVKPLALIYPQIAFKLVADQKVIFDLRSATPSERVTAVFGSEYGDKIIPVDESRGNIKVTGFIGNLDLVRVARGEQYLSINQRPVSDRLINNAVYQAYKSLIQRGEFPFYALNISVPLNEVDVNVHPTKTEVKFNDEWRVYHVVKETIENGLRQTLKVMPGFQNRPPVAPLFAPTDGQSPQTSFVAPPGGQYPADSQQRSPEESEILQKARQFSQVLDRNPVEMKPQRQHGGFIWQVHNKYILSQINNGIAIIDQHVAHERILYEEALRDMDDNKGTSQQLLFPATQEFSADDYNVLVDIIPSLNTLGFRLREFGPQTVLVEAVPTSMRGGSEGAILKEIIDYYRENRVFDYSPSKRLAASYSCKAAVKAGDPLTEEEMRVLVDRLFATENPFYCPHGRPIIVNLSIDELDKRFERH
ncbi:MAG: DNA mismatch repair endonuclease MutL [Candidatus Marinimicrobia bacterium]|jgi:DNA mismatch repair protein MutL|nr:DNA mismatch repair endonuclease MutL [Candidatus Neomarinimicrobiota bacterium]MBT3631390.1 DNA mismatch repair endonuclease MutL [Candidatus Neomarinimicrobiota bacterium]MBT3825389.1 DNA mismatch repair endonuclease MutL [Candidatus Neomarinimicrobiota bacterium]MBT4131490.1 DNA mismatch repair endonuclease MutL [Candidatus Neomarinimicrobiota bacterium]MBT4294817.1 DNA mismatch repair endonuclease MutL [Candidatus Neomarinimicrobiota bacterium]